MDELLQKISERSRWHSVSPGLTPGEIECDEDVSLDQAAAGEI